MYLIRKCWEVIKQRLKVIGMVRTTFLLSSGLAIGLCCGLFFLVGCAGQKQWEPNTKAVVYNVSGRQLPPQPVYNRIVWVRPPDVMPGKYLEPSNAPVISLTFHLSLTDSSIEEATQLLAQSARYTSYTASSLAHNKVSLDALGNIDELAELLAKKANVEVVVDHNNKEIRTLARGVVAQKLPAPRFAD